MLGVVDCVAAAGRRHERHPLAETLVRQPFVLGRYLCHQFFLPQLFQGTFHSPLLSRYLCRPSDRDHRADGVLCWARGAALANSAKSSVNFPSLRGQLLPPIPMGGQRVEDCERLLEGVGGAAGHSEFFHCFGGCARGA